MTPDDPRHGTTRGYAAGCKDDCCREARNAYERRRRKSRSLYGDAARLAVDSTGTIRRIRALQAIGWTTGHISKECGWTTANAVTAVTLTKYVERKTARTIARVYDKLCMTPGPSQKNLRDAARRGWFPPLAYDNIDDINERPSRGPKNPRSGGQRTGYDHAVVERILAGEKLPATPEERREVRRRWIASGRSINDLEALTGWRPDRYQERRAA